jgi:hypothetical protein
MRWTAAGTWRRLLWLGLIGGPLAGLTFSMAIWLPPALWALLADPAKTNAYFVGIAAVVGLLYGLVVGTLVMGAASLAFVVARRPCSPTQTTLVVAASAGLAAAACSFLVIAPVWPSLLNPWVVSAVTVPIAAIAYGLAIGIGRGIANGRVR